MGSLAAIKAYLGELVVPPELMTTRRQRKEKLRGLEWSCVSPARMLAVETIALQKLVRSFAASAIRWSTNLIYT